MRDEEATTVPFMEEILVPVKQDVAETDAQRSWISGVVAEMDEEED